MNKRARKTKKLIAKEHVESQGFQGYLWAQTVAVAMIGLILSVALHELFHILMHFEDIPRVGLFPQNQHGAIVEILVWMPQGYDLEGEEIIAYTITLVVMLLTVMKIFKMHDNADKRTASQILFPNDKEMQKLSPEELLKLAERAEPGETFMMTTPTETPTPAPIPPQPAKTTTPKHHKTKKRRH